MLQLASEQRVLLEPCSWETYERIVADQVDRSSPRFTYSNGALEIVSPSPEHEELHEAVKKLVDVACEELSIELRPLGSATHRRFSLQKGVEPDSAFYFGDVARDPLTIAPDLAVEVELTRSALDKLPIFAELGVPEVWRCRREGVQILRLTPTGYEMVERSAFLPLDSRVIFQHLQARATHSRSEWVRGLRRAILESQD